MPVVVQDQLAWFFDDCFIFSCFCKIFIGHDLMNSKYFPNPLIEILGRLLINERFTTLGHQPRLTLNTHFNYIGKFAYFYLHFSLNIFKTTNYKIKRLFQKEMIDKLQLFLYIKHTIHSSFIH